MNENLHASAALPPPLAMPNPDNSVVDSTLGHTLDHAKDSLVNTQGTANVDRDEVAKFDAIAARWWDTQGEFAPLHRLNPVRTGYVAQRVALSGRKVLDVGCGGGLLAEALARHGALVTAIDMSSAAIDVAELHALSEGLTIDYRCCAVESLVHEHEQRYDVVTCMEMLEHVPDPTLVIKALGRLVKPGGSVFVSTLNRNWRSFATAIVGAEYLIGLVPRGTHDYARFIRPSELARTAREADLTLLDLTGMQPIGLGQSFRLSRDVGVNYLAHLSRPGTVSL